MAPRLIPTFYSPPIARLIFRLGLGQADDPLAGLVLTALFQKIDALETLQNAAFRFNGAFALQAGMLTHGQENLDSFSGIARNSVENHWIPSG